MRIRRRLAGGGEAQAGEDEGQAGGEEAQAGEDETQAAARPMTEVCRCVRGLTSATQLSHVACGVHSTYGA